MVRLKVTEFVDHIAESVVCFHSKMVRLKVEYYVYADKVSLFPFQNGSIKSDLLPGLNRIDIKFPFQTGSIKSLISSVMPDYCQKSFHSKMVRLKVYQMTFQENWNNRFHSKMVRLKAGRCAGRKRDKSWFPFQNGSIKSRQ